MPQILDQATLDQRKERVGACFTVPDAEDEDAMLTFFGHNRA